MAIGIELDQSLLGLDRAGYGSCREHHWIHHGNFGQSLLKQVADGRLTTAGAHHHIGIGIEQAHQQGCL